MPFRYRENVQVVIGKETTFNNGQTTPDGYQFPFAALSGGITREFGKSPLLRGDAFESKPILGMQRGQFRFRAAATIDTVPRLFRLIGGAIQSSGAAPPYMHTVKGAANGETPSVWIEKWHADVSKGDLHYGSKIASIQIAVAGRNAAPVLAECAIVTAGKWERNRASRYDSTVDTTLLSSPVSSLADVALLVDNAAPTGSLSGATITIQLAQDPIDLLDGNAYSAALAHRWYEVTGQIEGIFDDADYIRGLEDSTHSVAIKVVKPGDSSRYFQITVPAAYLHVTDHGEVSGAGVITQRIEFTGYYDSTEQSSWKVVALNDTASYPSW